MGHKVTSFGTRCEKLLEIGQGVGICTRTVSVTVRDAAGYTTALISQPRTHVRSYVV